MTGIHALTLALATALCPCWSFSQTKNPSNRGDGSWSFLSRERASDQTISPRPLSPMPSEPIYIFLASETNFETGGNFVYTWGKLGSSQECSKPSEFVRLYMTVRCLEIATVDKTGAMLLARIADLEKALEASQVDRTAWQKNTLQATIDEIRAIPFVREQSVVDAITPLVREQLLNDPAYVAGMRTRLAKP